MVFCFYDNFTLLLTIYLDCSIMMIPESTENKFKFENVKNFVMVIIQDLCCISHSKLEPYIVNFFPIKDRP